MAPRNGANANPMTGSSARAATASRASTAGNVKGAAGEMPAFSVVGQKP
jgi:hypothetical protein